MMPTNKKKIVIASIIIFVVVIALTIGVLVLIRGATNKPVNKTTTLVAVLNATTIINDFDQQSTNGKLLVGSSVIVSNNKNAQQMYIKDPGSGTYIQVTAAHVAIITKSTGYTADQLASTTKEITTFLTQEGLSSVGTIADTTTLLNYASHDVSCQAVKLLSAGAPTQLQLLCANTTDYSSQVTTINQLLALWKVKVTKTTAYQLVSADITDKNPYTIAIVHTSAADLSTSDLLVYVKSAGTWIYIGDASKGTALEANEKFVINSDIKTGLDNEKYGSALHDVLFGSAQ